jgi:hypothetical protein
MDSSSILPKNRSTSSPPLAAAFGSQRIGAATVLERHSETGQASLARRLQAGKSQGPAAAPGAELALKGGVVPTALRPVRFVTRLIKHL